MKSLYGMIYVIILAAAIPATGCAKHPPTAELVPSPGVTERTSAVPVQGDPSKVVVAKVNGIELRLDALVTMMNRLAPKEPGVAPDFLEEHKKSSLDKLILQELAYQQAKKQGLGIGTDRIDLAISNLRENVGGKKEYAEYLSTTNVTEAELRAQVERSLTIELIYAREVLARVVVPEEELRQEYEREKRRYIVPEKASVIDVFVLKSDKTSARKARELRGKILANTNKDPWKLILDGSFIIRNLDIKKEQEQELFEAARELKPNELSGVLETPTGSHIIKLKSYSPEKQLTFDEVRSTIELKLKVPSQEKRMQEWERELKSGAKIEIIR